MSTIAQERLGPDRIAMEVLGQTFLIQEMSFRIAITYQHSFAILSRQLNAARNRVRVSMACSRNRDLQLLQYHPSSWFDSQESFDGRAEGECECEAWSKTMLAKKVSQAYVLAFENNADIAHLGTRTNSDTISEHASNLPNDTREKTIYALPHSLHGPQPWWACD